MNKRRLVLEIIAACILFSIFENAQNSVTEDSLFKQAVVHHMSGPIAQFKFDGNINNATDIFVKGSISGNISFVNGLDGQSLSLNPNDQLAFLTLDSKNLSFDKSEDFSVQCWIKSTMDPKKPFVILAQKAFTDNSLTSQKTSGWVLYSYGGTWAWTIGSSGRRRVTHENENGTHMPLNDGKWHQLTMTYNSIQSVVRLFYDGDNKASYKVSDTGDFDFTSNSPMVAGWNGAEGIDSQKEVYPEIEAGTKQLQELVDALNGLGLSGLKTEELLDLITSSKQLFEQKVDEKEAELFEADRVAFRKSMQSVDFQPITALVSGLMKNPCTVHQSRSFMEVDPLLKLYSLVDGKVTIDPNTAKAYTEKTRLYAPAFEMDNLAVWNRTLSPEEVLDSYAKHLKSTVPELAQELTSITAAVWNIEHGGKHFTVEEHGWDSRMAIAEMLGKENADVIMLQETYSSGDFIAAELGYYFAAGVDWDYLNQGANLSVPSRYPIKELCISETSPFHNVGVKISVSKTQDLYVMSNWYGMDQFPAVFEYHKARFEEAEAVPILFAGDFNAVPHTDGGDSPASRKLLDAGFLDAFRSLYPDVQKHPGITHRSGRRIDQLYYKGMGLKNTSTKVISTWSPGFPSDHYLIIGRFDLNSSNPIQDDMSESVPGSHPRPPFGVLPVFTRK